MHEKKEYNFAQCRKFRILITFCYIPNSICRKTALSLFSFLFDDLNLTEMLRIFASKIRAKNLEFSLNFHAKNLRLILC